MKHNLTQAKRNKNDEYYTYEKDIEEVLTKIGKYFKDKIIYCNCDDYRWSNFYIHLKNNFDKYQLKELYATNYSEDNNSYFAKFDGENEVITKLNGNGSFDSDECIEILKECDIVFTNPPFSLKQKYIKILLEYEKDYCIILPILSHFYTYKNVIGARLSNFYVNNENVRGPDCVWYNTFKSEPRTIIQTKSFEEYKDLYEYNDDDNILIVNKTYSIPNDYFGYMYVPLTFPLLCEFYDNNNDKIEFEFIKVGKNIKVNGKSKFIRLLIKRK